MDSYIQINRCESTKVSVLFLKELEYSLSECRHDLKLKTKVGPY